MAKYAIIFSEKKGGPCCRCGAQTGNGPIGFYGRKPLCDFCLMRDAPDLGALLILAQMAREVAALRHRQGARDQSTEALAVVSTWAFFYDQHAQKRWNTRIPDLVAQLTALGKQGPDDEEN